MLKPLPFFISGGSVQTVARDDKEMSISSMESMTSNPSRFAAWFNKTYPGAYRTITVRDVEDMTTCGLICRYRCYSPSQDGATIRGVLQYEQLRAKRSAQEATRDKLELPECKMCGDILPIEPEVKSGRPREYCSGCASLRNNERQKELRKRRRKHFK